jgi:hypothetical protein
MPSLRRALSTPSVRASPYPSLLTSRSQRSHPHGHRRSSGSDLTARKVLADIDWWRVADGQREKTGEEDGEGDEGEEGGEGAGATGVSVVDADPVSAVLPHTPLAATDHSENAGVGIGRPSTPDAGVRIFGLEYNSSQVIRLHPSFVEARPYPLYFNSTQIPLRQLPAPPPAVPCQSPLYPLSSLRQSYHALPPSNAYHLRIWVLRTPGQRYLSFTCAWRLSAPFRLSQNFPLKMMAWSSARSWPIPSFVTKTSLLEGHHIIHPELPLSLPRRIQISCFLSILYPS